MDINNLILQIHTLSTIAQTPQNFHQQQQRVTSPTNAQQQQQHTSPTSYGTATARSQLGLRNVVSDIGCSQTHQPLAPNTSKQTTYDDLTMTTQQQQQKYYNYTAQNIQSPQSIHTGYNATAYAHAHQTKNAQHKNWMQQTNNNQQQQTQQQTQFTFKPQTTRTIIAAKPAPTQQQQQQQAQQKQQQESKENGHSTTGDNGALPGAPAVGF